MRGSRKKQYMGLYWSITAVMASVAVVAWLLLRNDDGASDGSGKGPREAAELSAWLADWQWESGLQDLDRAVGGLDSLQVFAAYFDESDHLTFTEDFSAGFPDIRDKLESSGDIRMDLTLVNDIIREDGSESQKDPDLLTRLLADESSRGAHVDEILSTVERYGFDGVELDYERVKESDWGRMVSLIEELQTGLSALGKPLRVVLEPRAPLEELDWPEGPAYVMMAYNLYGGHSGPGPKADDAFIREQTERMEHLPGKRYIALAAGGFDWTAPKEAKGITERAAAELAKMSLGNPVRDADSGSIRYEYLDGEGRKHDVWYADGETLARWAAVASEAGASGIAIWRLGELGEGSLGRIGSGFGMEP